jgi:hypothetical protein
VLRPASGALTEADAVVGCELLASLTDVIRSQGEARKRALRHLLQGLRRGLVLAQVVASVLGCGVGKPGHPNDGCLHVRDASVPPDRALDKFKQIRLLRAGAQMRR